KKSAHLKGLEEVFERRTRRFSPFEVLGITAARDAQASETGEVTLDPGVGLKNPPMGGSSLPTSGPERPIPEPGLSDPGVEKPIPGVGRPGRVVVIKENTTTEERPAPGVDPTDPQEGVSNTPPTGSPRPMGGSLVGETLGFADIVAATQLGSRLGVKVRRVV